MILDNYWGYKNKKAANKLLLFLYTIFCLKSDYFATIAFLRNY